MTLPQTFATLPTGNDPASDLDNCYKAIAATALLPCTASGTNTITLTPLSNVVTVGAYTILGLPVSVSFIAAATSTGAVAIQIGALASLPLYMPDGVTQANAGDLVINTNYVALYNASLVAFVLVSPGYQEGSWTPGFQGSGTAGTFTYSNQIGRYIRIGNVIHYWARVTISAISVAPTGTLAVSNLPFTSSNVANEQWGACIGFAGGITLNSGSFSQLCAAVGPNGTQIQLYNFGSAQAVTNLLASGLGSSGDVQVSGTYRIN